MMMIIINNNNNIELSQINKCSFSLYYFSTRIFSFIYILLFFGGHFVLVFKWKYNRAFVLLVTINTLHGPIGFSPKRASFTGRSVGTKSGPNGKSSRAFECK